MIQSVEGEASWFLPQNRRVLPQVLIVLEHVKISSMGYASVVSLVGKQSTFSKYTQSALMHRPCFIPSITSMFIITNIHISRHNLLTLISEDQQVDLVDEFLGRP